MSAIQPEDGPGGGAAALRMLLGWQLRRLREAKGVSRETAGEHIRASESKISRMELGRVSLKERDVADLLALYGMDGHDREEILSLTRRANQPVWWQRYSQVLSRWFEPYLGIEANAASIHAYEVQLVPGLLQTRAYARAVISQGRRKSDPVEVEHLVDLRMERQQLFARRDPPEMTAILDEAVLRRPVGTPEVMREQISHLIDLATQTKTSIRVLPFSAGVHDALGGAFTILRFPEPDLPELVYIEQLTGALYLDGADDLEEYTAAMTCLQKKAESPENTAAMLKAIWRDSNRRDGRRRFPG